MEPAPERRAAHLDHAQAPPLPAVERRELFQPDHGMAETVQIQVVRLGGQIVEEQRRGVLDEQEAAQGVDLPAVAQRTLREQPDLGQAVEHDALRLGPLDLGDRHADGLAEFEIGRMDEALLLVRVEAEFRRDEFEDLDAVEGPAVAPPATFRSSRRLSDSVMYRQRSPRRTPSSRNCIASVVLPDPGRPSMRCERRDA